MAAPSTVQRRDAAVEVQPGPRYAFGLRLDSDLPLQSLPLGENDVTRRTRLTQVERSDVDVVWPRADVVSLLDRRMPSGRLVMSVDGHPHVGYRVAAPG